MVKRQWWFLMRFLGNDSDVNIETDHQEFRAWQWADPQTLPDLIVPFKRGVYERVVAEFQHLATPVDPTERS